jgi:hypothetical protein
MCFSDWKVPYPTMHLYSILMYICNLNTTVDYLLLKQLGFPVATLSGYHV